MQDIDPLNLTLTTFGLVLRTVELNPVLAAIIYNNNNVLFYYLFIVDDYGCDCFFFFWPGG